MQALVIELMGEHRGRPREEAPAWATFEMTPSLAVTLAQIDDLRVKLLAQERPESEEEQLRHQLTVEAIYHTNHIEGNRLTLPEVRAVVEAVRDALQQAMPLDTNDS